MTEKQYGGATGIPQPKDIKESNRILIHTQKEQRQKMNEEETITLSQDAIEKLKQAGEIAKQLKEYAREIAHKDVPLLEIANKIDDKILELGAKPAFPVNLSINEIAAHATPAHNDETKAHGLLKIDIGVHIDGYVADTAISIDLENSEENKKLIEAADEALNAALKIVSAKTTLREIGTAIETTIKQHGAHPVINLSGHSIDHYNLHSGITVPNYDNQQEYELGEGLFAIEPFATSGLGKVKDGKSSGIYHLEKSTNVRDPFAREVLSYIVEEYKTLPFCSRWLVKKFGTRALIALKRLEEAHILHHYPQLVEHSRAKVAQAEHTIIVTEKETIITT